MSDYSVAHYFLFVKKRKEGAAFLPDFRSRGILPPIDESQGQYIVLSLADGVSSCEHSAEGAKIACHVMTETLLHHASRFFSCSKQEISALMLSEIHHALKNYAYLHQHDLTEYSSTAACILFDSENQKALYFSIGDSLILSVYADHCQIIAMPSDSRNGCCVTTTEGAESIGNAGVFQTNAVKSVLLCSDGAWELMYHRNRLSPEIRQILMTGNYQKLKEILIQKENADDASFLSLNLSEFRKGNNDAKRISDKRSGHSAEW